MKERLLILRKKYKRPMRVFKELFIEEQLKTRMIESIKERDIQLGYPDREYRGYVEKLFRYKQNNANEITKAIVGFIDLMGGIGNRVSSAGRYVQGKKFSDMDGKLFQTPGSWIPSTTKKGTADVSGIIFGIPMQIEVKFGKDRLSPAQKKYLEKCEAAGSKVFVAKDFDSFFEWFCDEIL